MPSIVVLYDDMELPCVPLAVIFTNNCDKFCTNPTKLSVTSCTASVTPTDATDGNMSAGTLTVILDDVVPT